MLELDEMMRRIMHYPNGTALYVFWIEKGLELEGVIDTVYETYNFLEEDDPDYREFYACAIRITKILQKPADLERTEGNLIEISIEDQPSLITLLDGTVVWQEP
jgi:hypothetical protein